MDNVILNIKVLQRKENHAAALQLLKRVASQVVPIMRKRGWKVSHLCEFFPSNPNLLGCNINKGYKINIRLRPHYNETNFLDYNDLLGTMLHELAHIVRGPHDAAFYKLLDELNTELDQLILNGQKGYSPFVGEGYKLGGTPVRTMSDAKRQALAAAERRRGIQSIMVPVGGVRLGGLAVQAALSPSEMAARAAERRLRDQKWCGGLHEEDDTVDAGPSSDLSAPEIIELGDDDVREAESCHGKKRKRDEQNSQERDNKIRRTHPVSDSKMNKGEWPCPACTFINKEPVLACLMCLSERPVKAKSDEATAAEDSDSYWTCPQCTLQNEMQWWMCRACEYVKVR